ncbi:unnamed protein product [Acanthoscelides obtectus]|uniref:MADF domain-containing protein n=1 Tax=Acanthoscelides obtectus TaxID=200917 RepID=A0A9P0P5B3_ACAOB|nr:unnamed protein product [Acanthoscelides obtectus]CAK1672701.1 hypothetical protein AOBTE_LOCUS29054 [Acanthoscelides obtectus]
MNKKTWTIEEVTNLIEVYRERPNLWNPKNVDYKNRYKKYDSLKEIAEIFGTTKDEIERKLKNINTQYQRERRNYKKCQKSGAGNEFKAKWFGYTAMAFLQDRNKPKKGHQAGIEYDDSDSTDGSDNESLLEDRVVPQAETQENIEDFEVVRLEDRQSVQAGNQVPHQEQLKDMPSTPKRNTSEVEQFLVPPKSSRKKKGSNGGTQVRDEYNIYGELVGHQIRSLSTEFAKVTAQKLINDILFNAKLGKYYYPSYPQRNPSQTGSLTPFASNSGSQTHFASNSEASSSAMDATLGATNIISSDADVLHWAITNSFGVPEVQEANNN